MITNTVTKSQAWGSDEVIIGDSQMETWVENMPGEAIKNIRAGLGSVIYHQVPLVAQILKAQKERVGAILGKLDNELSNRQRTVTYTTTPVSTITSSSTTITTTETPTTVTATYDAWKTQGLESQWNTFMNSKYVDAHSKTMKLINNGIGKLKTKYLDPQYIMAAQDKPGDTPQVADEKKMMRKTIEEIRSLETAASNLPNWPNPF